ncbi:hypothetical protein, variant [Exophiala oligosperma]|uniref:Uncharacterized protein n=1 Tax=Exophiala oligosperma TaxID=215243 RepID=A0A0D2DYA1_9EURO|nr:hypothetical protein, variant [Exophiala oligosperma]KIW47580.1 hypothetical protein, variant [Exophiala oligosperma]
MINGGRMNNGRSQAGRTVMRGIMVNHPIRNWKCPGGRPSVHCVYLSNEPVQHLSVDLKGKKYFLACYEREGRTGQANVYLMCGCGDGNPLPPPRGSVRANEAQEPRQ